MTGYAKPTPEPLVANAQQPDTASIQSATLYTAAELRNPLISCYQKNGKNIVISNSGVVRHLGLNRK